MIKLFQKQQKTSDNFALISKVSDIRDVGSTELSPSLCFKEVISLIITELEENPFMEPSLTMRISKSSTTTLDYFQWLIPAPTRMDPNSSLQQSNALGWTESIAFLDKSLIRNPGNLWRKLKDTEVQMAHQKRRLWSLTVAHVDLIMIEDSDLSSWWWIII